MNKKILPLTTFVLVTILLIAGCNLQGTTQPGESTNHNNESEKSINDPITIDWVSGPQSGITYPFAIAVTGILEDVVPGTITNVGEGASISNAQNVNDNDAQMGHTQSDVLYAGINGEEPFSSELSDVRTWGRVMDFEYQFAVKSELGVSTFEEIKEKQVPLQIVVGERGYVGEVTTGRVLEAYGITYEDIRDWGGEIHYLPYAEGSQQIQNGHADAMGISSGAPTPVFQELEATTDLTFLSVKEEIIEELSEKYGLIAGEIRADYYESVEENIPTVAAGMQLIVHKDVPEDLVYTLTRSLFEEEALETLSSINKRFGEITPEYSGTNLVGPLHPGAERFFKEEGVID